ncbi:hypothetical protein [Haloferula sargassicola]|uniref:Uncharacterized protein n=1 Tax=Haloferula sargassicola TaxID=490096 RepID=A0ABP9UNG1_9BACT
MQATTRWSITLGLSVFLLTGALIWLLKSSTTPEADESTLPDAASAKASDRSRPRAEEEGHRFPSRFERTFRTVDQSMVEAAMEDPLEGRDTAAFAKLIQDWVDQDTEAAMDWARRLTDPDQKTLAYVYITSSLHEQPTVAYDFFCEMEKLKGEWHLYADGLLRVITSELQAYVDGPPERLVERLGQLPIGEIGNSNLRPDYPQGYDFAGLLQAMDNYRRQLRDPQSPSPPPITALNLSPPFKTWAERDLEHAVDYALNTQQYSPDLCWAGLIDEETFQLPDRDTQKIREIIAAKLNQLDVETFDRALNQSNIAYRSNLEPGLDLMRLLDSTHAQQMRSYLKEAGHLE